MGPDEDGYDATGSRHSRVSRMFFARAEVGSQHLSTGMTSFEPGTGLDWHIHPPTVRYDVYPGSYITPIL